MKPLIAFITSYILGLSILFISLFGGVSKTHETDNLHITPLSTQKGVEWAVFSPQSELSQYFHPNGFAWGNCTELVASLRPDIPDSFGNAINWMSAAQSQGFKTGTIPKVNAVAWFPVGGLGHVALVIGVEGNDVTIKEMNVEGLDVIDVRTIPAQAAQYIY